MREDLRLRRAITIILAIIFILSPLTALDVSADAEIYPYDVEYYISRSPIIYDYKDIDFKNDILIVNGYLVVSVTEFYNYFGDFNIEWNDISRSATVSDSANVYTVYAGTNYILKNEVILRSPATSLIYNGKIYASLKVMCDSLNLKTLYDEVCDAVMITKDSFSYNASYTYEDVYWLSRIVYAEAGFESYEGMVAVANVVLNRMADPSFPDTIYGVIFDDNGGIQFTPVSAGTIYNTPSDTAISAAVAALEGYNNVGWCLFFFNPRIARSLWIKEACSYYKSIGNHDFYY